KGQKITVPITKAHLKRSDADERLAITSLLLPTVQSKLSGRGIERQATCFPGRSGCHGARRATAAIAASDIVPFMAPPNCYCATASEHCHCARRSTRRQCSVHISRR